MKKQKAIQVVILGKEAENFLGLSYTAEGEERSIIPSAASKGNAGLSRWLRGKRIHQPMQETWVQPLGQEGPLEKEIGNLFQYPCLENPMHRGAWWAIVQRVAKALDMTW